MFARPIAATAALAAAGMLLAPTAVSAQAYTYQGPQNYGTGAYGQPYDYDSRYGYDDRRDYRYDDACRSYRNDRQAGGAVVGATLGAVAGSQLAARGRRTEGSILGGVLGAAVGAGVGGSSARDCGPYYGSDYRYNDTRYGNDYGYPSYEDRYEDRYGRYGRDDRYGYDDRYDSDDRYRYGQSGYGYDSRYSSRYSSSYQAGYGADRYGCRTVETRSYTRGGRLVTRYEQSCPDRY
jgi:hypothetical protein